MSMLESALQSILTLSRQGDVDAALKQCAALLPTNPDHVDLLVLTGKLLLDKHMYAPAEKVFRRSIRNQPKQCTHYLNLALALDGQGLFDQSLNAIDMALALEPKNGLVHFSRGLSLKRAGQLSAALQAYQKAQTLLPTYTPIYNNMGNVHVALGQYEEAIACYQKCVQLKPNDHDALGNWADACYHLRDFESSIALNEKSLALDSGNVKQLINYANALQKLNRAADALSMYDQALTLNAGHADAWCNRGNALRKLQRFDDAHQSFAQATALKPTMAVAHFNQAILHLLQGHYVDGWALYEWRWQHPELGLKRRDFQQPFWLGEQDLRGQHIFIWEEQGLGDLIQMMRYVHVLHQRGARVTLEVPPSLLRIAQTLDPHVEMVVTGQTPTQFDLHCSYMSLPLALGTTLDTIPAYPAYLFAPEDRKVAWRDVLGLNVPNEGVRVGLAWSGAAGHNNDHNRSVALETLKPLLEVTGAQFYSLQKEYRSTDQSYLATLNHRVCDLSNHLHDFSDTAALIEHMDIVIAVDTSVAHLAAAMGRTVWLIVPSDPDFRWLLSREDSPWYPSIRLFRKDDVNWLPHLCAALAGYIAGVL
jgi:tetratricopeptide (TPR) repeat protein